MRRALLALLLSLAGPLQASPQAQAWLARVAPALETLDFQGTVVHVSSGRMDTFRVYHRRDGGIERERLVAVSGPPRELIREGERVLFRGGQDRAMAFDLGQGGRWSPALAVSQAAGLRGYLAQLGGQGRVAGLPSQAVELRPRDHWRYGYRVWIEPGSGFPLRVDLLDGEGGSLEQVAFTEVALGRRPSDADLGVGTAGLAPARGQAAIAEAAPGWSVPAPPPGFVLRATRRWPGGEHLLYGDGLASVSVYIESADSGWSGASSIVRGSVNARAYWVDGWRVLAIGKVPAATVDHFARSVRPVAKDG